MRLLILSELHLEIWRENAPRIALDGSRPDIVVLAGDIYTGSKAVGWAAEMFDAFKTYIAYRVAEVHLEWIPASAMLRELQALGYTGQIRKIQEFCAPAIRKPRRIRWIVSRRRPLSVTLTGFSQKRSIKYALP